MLDSGGDNPIRRIIEAMAAAQRTAQGPSQAAPPDISAILGMLGEGMGAAQQYAAGPTSAPPDIQGLMDLVRMGGMGEEIEGYPVLPTSSFDFLSPSGFNLLNIPRYILRGRLRPEFFAIGGGRQGFNAALKAADDRTLVQGLDEFDSAIHSMFQNLDPTSTTGAILMRKKMVEELQRRGVQVAGADKMFRPTAEDLTRLFDPSTPTVNPPTKFAPSGKVERMAGLRPSKKMAAAGKTGPSASQIKKFMDPEVSGAELVTSKPIRDSMYRHAESLTGARLGSRTREVTKKLKELTDQLQEVTDIGTNEAVVQANDMILRHHLMLGIYLKEYLRRVPFDEIRPTPEFREAFRTYMWWRPDIKLNQLNPKGVKDLMHEINNTILENVIDMGTLYDIPQSIRWIDWVK